MAGSKSDFLSPGFALDDKADGALAYLIFGGEMSSRLALGRTLTNLAYLLFSQFAWPFRSSSLYHHICRIVSGSAQKKMIGPYTAWIIAMVADKEIRRDRADCKFVGHSMGSTENTSLSLLIPADIGQRPECLRTPFPEPATIRLIDLIPEALSQRDRGTTVRAVHLFDCLGGMPTTALRLGNTALRLFRTRTAPWPTHERSLAYGL